MRSITASQLAHSLLGAAVLSLSIPAAAADQPAPAVIHVGETTKLTPVPAPPSDANAGPAADAAHGSGESEVYYVYCDPDGSGRWGWRQRFAGGICTHSPDHGWSMPQRYPVVRQPASYTHFWPAHWYGAPRNGAAAPPVYYPMVATPTDTTQLGFYGQPAPHWSPNAYKLPPVPQPWQIHTRYCGGPMCLNRAQLPVCPHCRRTHFEMAPQPEYNGAPPTPSEEAPGSTPPAPQEFNKSARLSQPNSVPY